VANAVPGGHSNKCPNFAKPFTLATSNALIGRTAEFLNFLILKNTASFVSVGYVIFSNSFCFAISGTKCFFKMSSE
jgi:hypothetical protein